MQAVAVFTNRGLNRLLAEGGTQAWALNPKRVRKFTYAVCAQNRNDGTWGDPTHDQGQGFLIGKITAVEPAPDKETRFIIRFDEYAEIDVPNMAYQWRNPVRYIHLEDYGIDPNKLTFKRADKGIAYADFTPSPRRNPPADTKAEAVQKGITPLDMSDAKKALAAFHKVPVNAIEITIRG